VTGTRRAGGEPGRAPPRDLLIALNTRLDLHREAVIRLALGWREWLDAASGETAEIAARLGIRPRLLAEARSTVPLAPQLAAAESRRAAAAGARIVTLSEPDYPAILLDLELPPPVLYLRGALPERPSIAVVGSRRADAYALDAARSFARELAARGLTVVSGLARGVDAAAHRGALEAPEGTTVAVQACGIGRIYPGRHRELGERIARRGAVLTEFPSAAAPIARNFPVRNRVIAALSVGTLVVQAARRSGTLITARLALELGREIWAIPGSIFRQRAAGANELLRDGASIVLEPRDIVESLPLAIRDRLHETEARSVEADPGPEAGLASAVLRALREGTDLTAEQISKAASTPVAQVLAALAELEIAGLVRRCPGSVFRVTAAVPP
jgi:DNA processing protein